jgi:hypothetical protein
MKTIKLLLCCLMFWATACLGQYPPPVFSFSYVSYASQSITPTDVLCKTTNCLIAKPPPTGVTLKQIAAASDGSLWAMGTDNKIYQHVAGGTTWAYRNVSYANQIVTGGAANTFYRYGTTNVAQYLPATNAWANIRGAVDSGTLSLGSIAVGADGDLWGVDSTTTNGSCGFLVWHYNFTAARWFHTPYGATQISVANSGLVWTLCSDSTVRIVNVTNGAYTTMVDPSTGANVFASQIALGADGVGFVIKSGTNTPYKYDVTQTNGDTDEINLSVFQFMGSVKALAVGDNLHTYMLDSSTSAPYFVPAFTHSSTSQVAGTTTCTDSGSGYGKKCSDFTAQHTGNVNAKAFNFPGAAQAASQSVFWSSYLSVLATQSTTPQNESDCTVDWNGQGCDGGYPNTGAVICPVMGFILQDGWSIRWEYAHVKLIARAGQPYGCTTLFGVTTCSQPVQPWCTNTLTPDLNPVAVRTEPDGWAGTWDDHAICARVEYLDGTFSVWHCGPGGAVRNASTAQGLCTQYPTYP